jgi:small-conductance mechanosensitive channel
VVLSIALYLAEKWLELPSKVDGVFELVIVVGVALQLALWATAALRFAIDHHHRDSIEHPASVGVLVFVGQVLIWSIFTLLALDNLGVNITALVAGLGIGGIAIALAVQTVLGDLLGSLSIALDKPFVVGDQLQIDDVEGTVEHIGIKSTRLRSLTGEQVILANADVLKSRVHNLGRMAERRVLFRVGVAYETPPEKVDQVTDAVRRAVEAVPNTRFLQCPLISLGKDSLEFELIFYVANRPDVGYGTTVGAVNRGIFREFAAAGIGFAYPTRRLLVEQASPQPD